MSMTAQPTSAAAARTHPSGGTLADVLDRILDKGIVIDAWAAVSLLGIEILTVEAKVAVASVETYLKYANAVSSVGMAAPEPPKPVEKPAEKPVEITAAEPKPAPASAAAPKALSETTTSPGSEVAPAIPSDDELLAYLGEHAGGVRLDELADHFHAPKPELEAALGHLVEARRLKKDQAQNIMPASSPKG